jgi:stage V sporulation protein G
MTHTPPCVITEVRIRLHKGAKRGDILKAFATITLNNCFVVHNLKVIHGEDRGLFVSMPADRKGGRYQDIAHPITKDFRQEMEDTVIDAYHDEVSRNGHED